MRLVLANHSSYPRVGDSAHAQRVRRAYARRETGDLSQDAYLDVARDYIREVIAEQQDAGCDLVTDGQIHWYDCIAHPTGRLGGTRIDGLLRLFDTNAYVRRPEIVGALEGRFGLEDDYLFATTASSKPVKPVLTGPYTLARHTIAEAPIESVTMAYAEVVAEELRALAAAGADVVQIDEPSLLRFPQDAGLVRKALARIAGVRVSLVTYWGDAAPLYRELLDMPVDMLGFDLTYGPKLAELLVAQPPERPVALGVVDGRNTKLEGDEVRDVIRRVADAQRTDEMHVQPSCGLEHLPRDRAVRKLRRMRELVS